jgi:two-component system, OmpR family, sensor histidine kinase CiaH
MHSAAGIEDRLFTPARIRLTAWYVSVLAAVLIVLGTALYLVVREQLLNGVDNGVKLVAREARDQWITTDSVDVRGLSTGPYTVNFMTQSQLEFASKDGYFHLDLASMDAANSNGSDLRSSGISGDRQRVYSVRVTAPGRSPAVIQVTRSTEPEHEALSKLLAGLLIGGAGGLVLAGLGGWWLAGKSLRPVRVAFARQHAFVSDASHELRTPLAVIRANAEYLQQEQPENVEARDIVSETDRLSSLVDALLAVARDDDRGAKALHTQVDLTEVVEATVASFQTVTADHELELTHATPENLMVMGDRDQVRQVLVILLDNAVRYTPAGGRIHVQAREDGKEAVLTVHDTGIGIPEEALPRVFERFYRADDARNRQSGGVGLGLAIARELVTRHSGRISVTSTEGAGSTFTVRLPRDTSPVTKRSAAVTSPHQPSGRPGV